METCPYSPQISAYHDGELAGEAREQLEAHLSSACPPCMAELEQWRHLSALIQSAPAPSLPDGSRRNLYQLAPVIREAGFIRLAEWTTALAASVLIAVSTWMAVNRQQQQTSPRNVSAESSQSWALAVLAAKESESQNAPDNQVEPQFADLVASSFVTGGNGNHE